MPFFLSLIALFVLVVLIFGSKRALRRLLYVLLSFIGLIAAAVLAVLGTAEWQDHRIHAEQVAACQHPDRRKVSDGAAVNINGDVERFNSHCLSLGIPSSCTVVHTPDPDYDWGHDEFFLKIESEIGHVDCKG